MEGLNERLDLSSMVLTYISPDLIFTLLCNPKRGAGICTRLIAPTFLPTLPGSLILAEDLCFLNVTIVPLIILTHLS